MEILTHMFYFTGYIRSQSFARPLSREDEERCLAALQKGDAYARDQLIEHNLRLVAHIVKKYDIRRTQTDDLISIGTIGLIKAVDTFAPEKGKKLTTYASRCIENEILMFLRKKSRRRNEVSFDEPLNIDYDGNELLLSDVLGTEDDTVIREFEKNENRRELLKAMEGLKERERMIVQMRYGIDHEELTQKDIAKKLGISQSYISRLEKRILQKLKVVMKANS